MTDPIADMLIRIKNALLARKAKVEVPYSRVKMAIAKVLLEAGYIKDVKVEKGKPFDKIMIDLKYVKDEPAITDVRRESKPGRRTYVSAKEIPQILNGFGMCVISTSSGVMSGKDARAKNLGGELICSLW